MQRYYNDTIIGIEEYFDRVLVDTECTHDGSIQHIYKCISTKKLYTNLLDKERLFILPLLQRRLCWVGYCHTNPNNGILMYSTCSLSIMQNQHVVLWLINLFNDIKVLNISGMPSGNIPKLYKTSKYIDSKLCRPIIQDLLLDSSIVSQPCTLFLTPHHHSLSGMYICALRRGGCGNFIEFEGIYDNKIK